jgi:hypothetical protein
MPGEVASRKPKTSGTLHKMDEINKYLTQREKNNKLDLSSNRRLNKPNAVMFAESHNYSNCVPKTK